MKRPQSAKQARHYFVQSSLDEGTTQDNRTFAKQSRKILNAVSTSNDLSRLLPKRIAHDKERLYYQALQLKTSLNQVTEENIKLKTKVAILEREKERLGRVQDVGLRRGGKSGTMGGVVDKQNGIVANLKKMVREGREENQKLKSEIARLKKNVRYTKINQLEQQMQTIYQQNKKQSKLIVNLQVELTDRVRNDHHLEEVAHQLKTKTEELREVTQDNAKFEELLQQHELRNQELIEKIAALEKKMQKDVANEKKKVQQLNRTIEILKRNNQDLSQKLEQEKKKQTKKPIIRPSSSNPYSSQSSQPTHGPNSKDKELAIELNLKLKKELEEARQKLAISESELKRQDPNFGNSLNISSEPFELVLTKEELEPNLKKKGNWVEGPKQGIKKATSKASEAKKTSPNEKILQQLRQILTNRMKYNRYTFEELKADIEASPIQQFTAKDLMTMLKDQPFCLNQFYATEFLKQCLQTGRINLNSIVPAQLLLNNLRKVIDQFTLLEEDEEEQLLYHVADFMTRNRKDVENQFKKLQKAGQIVSRCEAETVLRRFKDLSEDQIQLAICYVSVSSDNLEQINYNDILDKFMMNENSSMHSREGEQVPGGPTEQELSLGQNEPLQVYDDFEDDEMI